MMGLKNIIFEKNNKYFSIEIDEICKLSYSGVSVIVDRQLMYEYLNAFIKIVSSWKEEYTNYTTNDFQKWNLTIIFLNGKQKHYCGYSDFPSNFEMFEFLNQKLIDEVL